MQKNLHFRVLLWLAAVALGVHQIAVSPSSEALAQEAKSAGPVSLGPIFPGDGVDPTKAGATSFVGAAKKAAPRGECPRGVVTVFVPKGDEHFQPALALARRDALLRLLGDNARHFVFVTNIETKKNDVQIDYNLRDLEPPKLETSSVPPKNSKVKSGQVIRVTMIARDDANLWQSGIQSIQLLAESEGNRSIAAESWRPTPRTCENTPPVRRLEAIYRVPTDPPPIIRLRAVAEDYVNRHASETLEFPTGDWYGRLKWTEKVQHPRAPVDISGDIDISLDYDGRGNVSGTMVGTQLQRGGGQCPWETITPGRLTGKLNGSYTAGRAMSLFPATPVFISARIAGCQFVLPEYTHSIHHLPQFGEALRSLRRVADDKFEFKGEWTLSPAPETTATITISLTIERAQN